MPEGQWVKCPKTGEITNRRELEDNLLVFPINVDLAEEEQFLTILRTSYNVTELPTLIINGEKYPGVVGRQDLARIICEQTENKEQCLL